MTYDPNAGTVTVDRKLWLLIGGAVEAAQQADGTADAVLRVPVLVEFVRATENARRASGKAN